MQSRGPCADNSWHFINDILSNNPWVPSTVPSPPTDDNFRAIVLFLELRDCEIPGNQWIPDSICASVSTAKFQENGLMALTKVFVVFFEVSISSTRSFAGLNRWLAFSSFERNSFSASASCGLPVFNRSTLKILLPRGNLLCSQTPL